MRTVILGERPREIEELIERRQRLGLDGHDEVWAGEYHMSPEAHPRHGLVDRQVARVFGPLVDAAGLVDTGPFNLGDDLTDFRVPDAGVHRTAPSTVFVPTALLVVEVLSPSDESWQKLGFYAAREVAEVVMVDPLTRTVTWLARNATGDGYDEVERSAVLDVDASDVAAAITWPDV